MAGKAILTCRPNSHPFQERTLILEQPVKIGRSVARARAASNNAIFDCKVLSRNHAVFWYTNGKFYLQDTKSSNGTFVNNQRLSKSGEESAPREVCSGDIVQFGVDVVENTRKIAHGCIIANLKLFLPDGKEAKASDSSAVVDPSVEDLYQLNQYIQEASQREQMIESKLFTLRTVLENIQQATEQNWKALIAEDRLLSRLEILENQLQTCSKNFPEDKLREELRKLQEDKHLYQNTAKDNLRKVLEEKLEATQKCQEVNRSLLSVQAEYANVCEQMTRSHKDIQELAQKLSSQIAKNDEMETKLQEVGAQHKDTVEKLETRNYELEMLLGKQQPPVDLESQFNKKSHFVSGPQTEGGIDNKTTIQAITTHGDGFNDTPTKNMDTLPENMDENNLNNLEGKTKHEEVIDLLCARLELMRSKRRGGGKVHQINIEGDWDEYSEKQCEGEKEFSKEESFEQKLEICDDDIETASTGTLEFDFNMDQEDEEMGQTNNMDGFSEDSVYNTFRAQIRQKEAKIKLDPSGEIVDSEKVKAYIIDEEVTIEDANSEFERCSIDQRNFIADDTFKLQDNNQENINWRDRDEEKDLLKRQLMEAKQVAKQSRNEAARLAERLRGLTSELERTQQNNSAATGLPEDNRTKEELDRLKQKCGHLQAAISSLESQNTTLKEEYTRLQTEKRFLEETKDKMEKEQFDDADASLESSTEMKTRVLRLEEELAIVGTKYMHCNEERTKLYRELNNLKLDYQAITHQPYFNLIFALPCVILFVAVIIAFYPTLSWLTGTSDHP